MGTERKLCSHSEEFVAQEDELKCPDFSGNLGWSCFHPHEASLALPLERVVLPVEGRRRFPPVFSSNISLLNRIVKNKEGSLKP